jgi:hypothetical protein
MNGGNDQWQVSGEERTLELVKVNRPISASSGNSEVRIRCRKAAVGGRQFSRQTGRPGFAGQLEQSPKVEIQGLEIIALLDDSNMPYC